MACPAASIKVNATVSNKPLRGQEHGNRCTFISATHILDSSDMLRRMADPALIWINVKAHNL
jgi:hypothetical protein